MKTAEITTNQANAEISTSTERFSAAKKSQMFITYSQFTQQQKMFGTGCKAGIDSFRNLTDESNEGEKNAPN